MISKLRRLLKDKSGATAIEYGLIAALVSVAAVVALGQVGTSSNFPCGTAARHCQRWAVCLNKPRSFRVF